MLKRGYIMKAKNVTNGVIVLALLVSVLMSAVAWGGGGESTPKLITVSASCDDLMEFKHISVNKKRRSPARY